jgi:DNA recombination protein RmuC
MLIALAIAGCIICALAAYLLGDRRARAGSAQIRTDLALASQRHADATRQLAAEKELAQALRQELAQSQSAQATLTAQIESARANLLEQRKLLDEAQLALRDAFASVSAEALARNNEQFLQLARERFSALSTEANGSLDQRKQQIEAMLQPLSQLLGQYQVRAGEMEKARVESYSMLREQLGTLAETQRTLNMQTSQLVTALSRPAVRGQWGEISLRRLVELAGLSDRCDFIEQLSVETEQGRLRPDMVVKLPGERDVVIDCKTSLEAFLDAAATTDDDVRRGHLQRHAQHVRSRARELGAKSYWSQFDRSPEFVVMFLPGEAFLYAAVEHDGSLIEDCLKNGVILATPTTLIALLKAIEFGWRQELAAENAEQIRQLGQELYERIGIVLGHISKLGGNLTAAVTNYNSAVASLETRVTVTARKMGELGAKSDKELPETVQVEVVPRPVQSSVP